MSRLAEGLPASSFCRASSLIALAFDTNSNGRSSVQSRLSGSRLASSSAPAFAPSRSLASTVSTLMSPKLKGWCTVRSANAPVPGHSESARV